MLSPQGNSTREELVSEILTQLNDPNNEFWSKPDIRRYLQRCLTHVYNLGNRMNSERHIKTYDFYYEANREYMYVSAQVEITSSNKWFDADIGGGEISTSISEGIYDYGTLRTEIETKLQALDSAFYCNYDESINKFIIGWSGNFTIKWSTGSHASSNFGEIIGFDTSADDNGSNSLFTADDTKTHVDLGRMKVKMLEDRTDKQPGPLWTPSESLEQQHEYNWILASTEYYAEMPKYKMKYAELYYSGSRVIDLMIFASPIPTSRRSLRLYYQGIPPTMNNDYVTSGLFPEEEEVVVIRTCILAKFQEIDKAPVEWKKQLEDAELTMRQSVRPVLRGPKRITYIPD